jgi:hypothetical protein
MQFVTQYLIGHQIVLLKVLVWLFLILLIFFINKNLAIIFSHSVRYILIKESLDEISDNFGVRPANNDLIFDYHLDMDYHLKILKNSETFASIDISFLNRGTEVVSKRSFFDNNGNLLFSTLSSMDGAYKPGNLL